MAFKDKRIAVLSPVGWRTPPRAYRAWETVASNIAEGLIARGWDVTLFATKDSVTNAKLQAVIEKGCEEDKTQIPKVSECMHMDLGSCREVISDGETGFLVNDVDEAVTAVDKINTIDIDRKNCLRRVEENFTIECMVQGYEKVYGKIFQKEKD